MADKPKEKPAPPPLVQVAYAGRMTEFKLYADTETGAEYVKLPNGKKALVAKRRDGTYVVAD